MLNLIEVDKIVENFLSRNQNGINTLHKIFFKNDNQLSLRSLISALSEDLKDGCVTFINKGYPINELDSYLFYIANAFCKKNSKVKSKKKTEYLCPGCLFLGKQTILFFDRIFYCSVCKNELSRTSDHKIKVFHEAFYQHNKNGYSCTDCLRFIPHPLKNSKLVICPYFDCCFVGDLSSLGKKNHPTTQSNPEKLILDSYKDNISLKEKIVSNDLDPLSQISLEEDYVSKIKTIKDVIDLQYNSIAYNSSEFTIKHKMFVYQAFLNLLDKYPVDMVSYLIDGSRSGGFQHKVFQEYIRLLENSLPFIFKKNKQILRIDNLLDKNLNIFDGISVFEAIVNDKGEIKNNTSEFYIGGRKAAYTLPYYIGKLLSIIDKNTNLSLIDHVEEYSFNKIKVKNVKTNTEVIVTHLRIPPHYQMGGMVYVNRIRKKITDKALLLINKS